MKDPTSRSAPVLDTAPSPSNLDEINLTSTNKKQKANYRRGPKFFTEAKACFQQLFEESNSVIVRLHPSIR